MNVQCKFLDLEQNTQEWLDFRKGKIGASDIPIILGISPYCTPYTLWRRQCGFEGPQETNAAMEKGHFYEPILRDQINEETDSLFVPVVAYHKDLKWAIASLDGVEENKKIIWECKYNNKEFHELAKKNQVPDIHFPQVQWQMFVTGIDVCWYTSYCNDEKITVEVSFDPDYITNIALPAALEFLKCMETFEAPAMLERDVVEITEPEFISLAHEYVLNKNELNILKKKEDELRAKLLNFTDDSNCMGGGIKISRVGAGKVVKWKDMAEKMLEDHPELKDEYLEQFTEEQIGTWRITIQK